MKIGPLTFQQFAARKPLTLDQAHNPVTAQQIVADHALAKLLPTRLAKEQQVRLTLDRLALEPEFKYGNLNGDVYSKGDVIRHVKEQTDLGRSVVQTEMTYCDELIAGVLAKKKPRAVTFRKPGIARELLPRLIKRCFWIPIHNRALFCECTTDGTCEPFATWRIANIHPAFAARGFTVVALTGADDVRAKFVPEATKAGTVFLGGVGHGGYAHYTGHWPAGAAHRDRILEVGGYAATEVDNKSIHFLSCETGRDLGPDTVAHGARSYGGYKENFNLVWDEGGVSRWELFAEADAAWDLTMASGKTAQEAYDATVASFNAKIASVPGTWTASVLTQDRNDLVLCGEPAAKILPYRWLRICYPFPLVLEKAMLESGKVFDDLP